MGYYPVNPYSVIAEASNVRGGQNPPFTRDDFFKFYNQFMGQGLPDFVLDQFILMADSVVKESRWHTQWQFGMALYIAHFSALYLQTLGGDDPTAKQVIAAAQAKGLQTSKSVGSVSVSYSFEGLDVKGWENMKSTQFGRQFIGMAKLLGKAPMYVW